jgi:adenylate cyclase
MGTTLGMSAGRRPRLTLRLTVPAGIVLIIVAVAASLMIGGYLTSAAAVRAFTRALLDPLAAAVSGKARRFLDGCGGSATLAADMVAGRETAPSRLDEAEAIGFALVRERPELFYVQFGDPAGDFRLVTRAPGGGIDTQSISRAGTAVTSVWSRRAPGADLGEVSAHDSTYDAYDPRTRPWYLAAAPVSDVRWTDIYTHAADGRPVITAAHAVRTRDGTLVGVAAAAVSLEGLSDYLDTLRIHGRPARAFVADADGTLVAASSEARAPSALDGGPLLDGVVPEIAALVAAGGGVASIASGGATVTRTFTSGDHRYLGLLQPLTVKGGRAWVVGAAIPEDDFLGEIKAGYERGIAGSLAILIAFVILGLVVAGRITRPLQAIAEETSRLLALEFSDRPLPDSIFEEVASISEVYAKLKVALRAFGRYVPVSVVSTIAAGVEPALGGKDEELTVFFSDIREFAGYAQEQGPDALAEVLSRYLASMVQQITAQGGTIDKFIGDAVMAFWNAPVPVDDHAYRAVLAAIRCQEQVGRLPEAAALYTRIGVHTSHVAVGNFGAPDRFAYTALGDGVNLASRMEGVNKEYGTQILITDSTFSRLRGRIACRHVDRIAVKGRRAATEIYEVLGEPDTVDPALVEAARVYESALEAFFARDFTAAAQGFAKAATMRPGDHAAEVMKDRCERYRDAPPGPDWTGVWAMKTK